MILLSQVACRLAVRAFLSMSLLAPTASMCAEDPLLSQTDPRYELLERIQARFCGNRRPFHAPTRRKNAEIGQDISESPMEHNVTG